MLSIKDRNHVEAREDDEEGTNPDGTPLRRSHGLTYIRRFLATKNSWKGKYQRLFCVCEASILTLNPNTLEVTNEWSYANDLLDVTASGVDTFEFSITVKKEGGKSSMFTKSSTKLSFTCEHRAALITSLLRCRSARARRPRAPRRAMLGVRACAPSARRPPSRSLRCITAEGASRCSSATSAPICFRR